MDGRDRTALATAEVYLHPNGWVLAADDEAVHGLTMGVAAGERSKADAPEFFDARCPRTPDA